MCWHRLLISDILLLLFVGGSGCTLGWAVDWVVHLVQYVLTSTRFLQQTRLEVQPCGNYGRLIFITRYLAHLLAVCLWQRCSHNNTQRCSDNQGWLICSQHLHYVFSICLYINIYIHVHMYIHIYIYREIYCLTFTILNCYCREGSPLVGKWDCNVQWNDAWQQLLGVLKMPNRQSQLVLILCRLRTSCKLMAISRSLYI